MSVKAHTRILYVYKFSSCVQKLQEIILNTFFERNFYVYDNYLKITKTIKVFRQHFSQKLFDSSDGRKFFIIF
jgi:hypothetical protein